MNKQTHIFYETTDKQGRRCLKLDRKNGRILARWRDDMPGQCRGRYQWVREKRAVLAGYDDMAYDAIRYALYMQGLSDFNPFVMCPETMAYDAVYIQID